MSSQLHEWDIHIVRRGADDASGAGGAAAAEKLGRRIIGWDVSRYEDPSSYPVEAPRGPVVAIADEYASSGGDIVIQALKSYGIATVVGTRTWGRVRGVAISRSLRRGLGGRRPTAAIIVATRGAVSGAARPCLRWCGR
jgi:tricorn protease